MHPLRRIKLLPPNIILSIACHLEPAPVRRYFWTPLVEPNRHAGVRSFFSKTGPSYREEQFKETLEKVVKQSKNPQNWPAVPATYNHLLRQYRETKRPEEKFPALSQMLGELMVNLTYPRTPNRVVDKIVASIFQDIKDGLWRIPLSADHYLAIIRSRAQNEDFEGAEAYLKECLDTIPFSAVHSRVFVTLLGEYRRVNDYESVWRVYRLLKQRTTSLDLRIYDLVQDVLMSSPTHFVEKHILELQTDYETAQVGAIPTLNLLLATFVALGQEIEANAAASKLKKALEAHGRAVRFSELRGWEALVRYSFLHGTPHSTKAILEVARQHGYKSHSSLLHRMVIDHKMITAEQLRECEDALSIQADTIAWTLIIHQSLAAGGIQAALPIYVESKRAGIAPAAYAVHPLMRALCGAHLRKELKWQNVEAALRLYNDLVESKRNDQNQISSAGQNDNPEAAAGTVALPAMQSLTDETESPQSSSRSSSSRSWTGPDSLIYDTLLRAIAQLARTISPHTSLQYTSPTSIHRDSALDRAIRSRSISSSDTPGDHMPSRKTLWDVALDLLDDMRTLNIPSSPMSTTAIIILAMRIAPTFQAAFQVYRAMAHGEPLKKDGTLGESLEDFASMGSAGSQFFNQFELTASSYENIIRGFCTLKPIRDGGVLIYPPAELYLEIVKDMQIAGYGVTEDVYMTFLYRLGRQARSLRLWEKEAYPYMAEDEEIEGGTDLQDLDPTIVGPQVFLSTRHSILHGIRTMHNHIVLNAGITPSIELLNAMLDAYNKVAAVHDAFKVWDTIFLSRIYDTQSVSIVLDTCGWAKVGHKAAQIWNQLMTRDFQFNKNNWDSRVECLCRLGRLDDALKIVCLEMPAQNRINAVKREQQRVELRASTIEEGEPVSKIAARAILEAEEQKHDITPDVKTLGVLFSFATKTNQVEEVKSKVMQYLPRVWFAVPRRYKQIWTQGVNEEAAPDAS